MLRFAFNFVLFSFLLGLIFFIGFFGYFIPQLPNIGDLENVKLQVPLRIYSQDHTLIAEFGEKRREPVTIDKVPKQMVQAFLAAEDARFYKHPGVDWRGIMRAVLHLVRTGEKSQGGSTITMQVARNLFLSREKTYLRKLNEILLALKIEKTIVKDKILEIYLNKIYLGHRSYGIAAAAQTYYGSEIGELNLAQTAMLAALPKAPSTTNPISKPSAAKKRRNYVLQRMLLENFISQEDYQRATNAPITANLHNPKIELEAPYVAELVRKQLIEQYGEHIYVDGLQVITTIRDKHQAVANLALRKTLLAYDKRHGYRGPEEHYTLQKNDGEAVWQRLLKSHATIGHLYPALVVTVNDQGAQCYLSGVGLLDIGWQKISWARTYRNKNTRASGTPPTPATVLQAGDIIRLSEDSQGQWQLAQLPDIEGSFVSLDPNNGATLALAGGFDFRRSKFNRVTQARRQPGSGFKPFIYSAALAAGKTAATVINDAPVIIDDPGSGGTWRPENYSHKHHGPTRLREALTHSRNLVSVRLLDTIGLPTALAHIEKFGFNADELPHNLSLALGSATLTPWQMANAYCIFANGGYAVEPHLIKIITSKTNDILYQANHPVVCQACPQPVKIVDEDDLSPSQESAVAKRVVDERNIWIMNSITRDVIKQGTGRRALELKRRDLSGKTGTTNEQKDAWFYGYNTDIVGVAWVGFDDFQPLGRGETGARVALPIWIEYMKVVLRDTPDKLPPEPAGLVYARINKTTGRLAKADDPDTMFEVFRAEHAPTAADTVYPAPDFDHATDDQTLIDLF